ncbi:unnamed protein product [Mesocestoides corti]|uniref:39S ribosomal protein L37, mitochondrial n=1 Tax=Mesocestoides corti TaxID=53468 RepID=A0A0R3UMI6_MESCO|nr:unnamed protein product [Mesocestoides corti]
MRFSLPVWRRIRHDFLPVYIKKQWREHGSLMVAKRVRVPRRIIDDPKIAEVAAQAEDTFASTRYRDDLTREIEIGATPEERAAWERQRAERLAAFCGDALDPPELPPSLIFEPTRLFCRDIAQVGMLTNTVVRHGPPPAVQSLYEEVAEACESAPDNTSLVSSLERSILHAHLWHTDEDKLPKRYNPDLIIWKFKTEYGIHPTNVARYLLQNLFRICELQSSRMHLTPASDAQTGMPARWLLRDRLVETSFLWGDERRRVQFSQRNDLVLLSPRPTPLFEQATRAITNEDVQTMEEYKGHMHLLSPLIDLTSTRCYRQDSSDGILTSTYPHPQLITVNVALPNTWSDFTAPEKDRITVSQRQAIGLMHCYASCIATAKRLFGDDCHNTELPEPISVEAVCTDGVFFDFIAFQLNTLEAPNWATGSPTTTVNVAWLDGNHELVRKRYPKRSMLRNTKYTDLDMHVFYRLFARYLYGIHKTVAKEMGTSK